MSFKGKRLAKEYKDLVSNQVPGITCEATDSFDTLVIQVSVLDNPLYIDDSYRLRFIFSDKYPFSPPQVQFIDKIPIHPHIYSNGHICLNILGNDWTPSQTVASISMSVQSMLASNNLNQRPPDDDNYVKHAPENPQHSSFYYHDDTV
ncbi:hypothetical protein PP7435_CHR1-1537 [Komagataella phaffii CBS 7435]|uniref:Ubiquitin-conjugating enzyme n=2 Tax=Komagataella phaffii TaxID=460519 RepID=C4QZB3_KOMPG|nr:ubiquitin-conjugating enzyme [Komagataella phaffii GS115]AOA61201.1 GQ67_01406T0 [Komagataella phaffii]KAI0464058.1 hypothetical protein LJB42_001659 [Komagataella kurtzmanii]CAH2447418.1 hypothetical protein BQ9382_C1-8020 [Komagataella phaffii CBS 7435]AOA66281.1 GQ68_01422T0 [Komagataella phaffii GS115]CAY68587.1 ubiquitin-conjugating enzyme [Komagataella phaffii GS115]